MSPKVQQWVGTIMLFAAGGGTMALIVVVMYALYAYQPNTAYYAGSVPDEYWNMIYTTIISIFGLLASTSFFISHAIVHLRPRGDRKYLWIILLFITGFMGHLAYYTVFVKEDEDDFFHKVKYEAM